MVQYRSLRVAVFENECLSGLYAGINGFSTKMDGYVSGVFRAGKVFGALDHAPGKVQSFNNPERFENLDALRARYPVLAEQITTQTTPRFRNVRDIRVYEAQLLNEYILDALFGVPKTVTDEDSGKQPERDPGQPIFLTRD